MALVLLAVILMLAVAGIRSNLRDTREREELYLHLLRIEAQQEPGTRWTDRYPDATMRLISRR
jgi:hypothetical protein